MILYNNNILKKKNYLFERLLRTQKKFDVKDSFLKYRHVNFKKAFIICIVKKKKNNFFVTAVRYGMLLKVLFVKSCGSLSGIRGSKKHTTVAVESLGKETFLKLFALGFSNASITISFRFRVNKFSRSFCRGFLLYSKLYTKARMESVLKITHNGLRARKKRRV